MACGLSLQSQTLYEMECVGTLWIKVAELVNDSIGTLRIEAWCDSKVGLAVQPPTRRRATGGGPAGVSWGTQR